MLHFGEGYLEQPGALGSSPSPAVGRGSLPGVSTAADTYHLEGSAASSAIFW